MSPDNISRTQAIAHWCHVQQLDQRLPVDQFLDAAGGCAVPNTPPGAAAESLSARVEGITSGVFQTALEQEKTLLQTWSLRGAPHIFPTRDFRVFTNGLRPIDDVERLSFIIGIKEALKMAGMELAEVLDLTESAINTVLDSTVICSKRELDHTLYEEARKHLSPGKLASWDSPSIYGSNQTLGEAMISFCLRLAALDGRICFTARQGNETCFGRTDQWLKGFWNAELDLEPAAIELTKKYLQAYGPSTPAEFGHWLGTGDMQTRRMWNYLLESLVEVRLENRKAWVLKEWPSNVKGYNQPSGVRFLPAHDPYLQIRNHDLLIPDKMAQRAIWKAVGSPGVLLVDGEIAGTWQARKAGTELKFLIRCFSPVPEKTKQVILEETKLLASLRGCRDAVIETS